MTSPHPNALTTAQAHAQLDELTVIDVRTPGEYASGHLPGAHNVPLNDLDRALPALPAAAEPRGLLVVCASGGRSGTAVTRLAGQQVSAATLTGGTTAWRQHGHELHRPAGAGRAVWAMERQVRFSAGLLVLLGVIAGYFLTPLLLVPAAVASGLIFSAVTDTCAMAVALARLPHNRPSPASDAPDLEETLATLAAAAPAAGHRSDA